jgi:hypothetical protein
MSRADDLLFDAACRATTPDEAARSLDLVARARLLDRLGARPKTFLDEKEIRDSLEWAREAIAYWAGYFSHDVRLRVEKLYGRPHPVLGPATDGPADPRIALLLGMSLGAAMAEGVAPPFPWPRRAPPYPDEP